MPKKLVWIFSKKYIAGETIEDAIRVSKELNSQGIKVTIDLLGEFITDLKQAEENRETYLHIIDRIQAEKIEGNYSLKPTSFGLLLDTEICYRNIRQIVEKAAGYNTFNRLCKGIYVEPEAIAYKKYQEINDHYLADLEYIIRKGMVPGIATHDKPLVEGAYLLISKYNLPKSAYEFQMLYGVTPELRKSIVEKGHTVRVYVPFGKEWFGYSTRRLKENPKMASHIIKALFIRK
jgi:proline dehydrogenase